GAERRQQARDVVVLAGPGGEDDRDLGEERLAVPGLQVVPHGEDEPGAGGDVGVERGKAGAAPVGAGHRATGRDPGAAGPDVEGNRHPGRRAAERGVENVRRYGDFHGLPSRDVVPEARKPAARMVAPEARKPAARMVAP